MSCGCKNNSKVANSVTEKELNEKAFGKSIYVKIIIFLFSTLITLIFLVPIIIPFIIILLFNRIVLNTNTDLTNFLYKIGTFLRTSNKRKGEEDDEDEDISEINPDEYELVNVDVIK